MKKILVLVAAAMMTAVTLTSCSDDEIVVVTPDQPVVLNCAKPDYLKAGRRQGGADLALVFHTDGERGEDR